MLSPGQDYLIVPKDLKANLKFRLAVLEKALVDKQFRNGLIEICKKDFLFYVNVFVWQANPKKKGGGEVGPFISWPFQDRSALCEIPGEEGILWCIENDEDFVVEKSREMGATWWFIIIMDWLDRFHPYHDSLMISKSAQAVDGPSRNSLFGKLRFIHEHLPLWLHDPDKHIDNKMYQGYSNKSTATGESSTGRAGVGGRASEMFIDEFSQIEEDWEVYHRTAATTGCRMFNGTHMGLGTAFYALTQNEFVKKIQFHWTQHPDKNQGLYSWDIAEKKLRYWKYNDQTDSLEELEKPEFKYRPGFVFDKTGKPTGGPHPSVRSPWYDKEFRRIGENESEMARDQDINPKGSVSQFYNALVIKQLKADFGCYPYWEGELRYDKENGTPLELVPTVGGRVKLWLNLRDGKPPFSEYGAGADISNGVGATPSCLSIMDGRTGEKVLEYSNAHIDAKEFGVFCVAMCRLFCDENGEGAKICWEHQGPGSPFGQTVWKILNYRNLYYATQEHSMKQTVSDNPGWNPTGPNRLNLHTQYRSALFDRRCLNRSITALDETLAFKHTDKGSVEHSGFASKENKSAARENHGDVVIADALACKMVIGDKKARIAEAPKNDYLDERSFAGRRRMRTSLESRW